MMKASVAMFTASLFSVLDGAFDHLLVMVQGGVVQALLPALYLLGWVGNLLSVVVGLGSMEVFLRFLQRFTAQP